MTDVEQADDRDGDQADELDRVPEREQHDQIDPARPAFADDCGRGQHQQAVEDGGGQADERSPLDAGAGMQAPDEDVAGREAPEQVVEAGADLPNWLRRS